MKGFGSQQRVTEAPRRNRAVQVAVALAIQTSLMQVANAQQASDPAEQNDAASLEQVTVTGSRIARRDYEANSPIQTIDASALETDDQRHDLDRDRPLHHIRRGQRAARQRHRLHIQRCGGQHGIAQFEF